MYIGQKHKARLVAKGHSQVAVDYEEKCATTVKYTSI